MLWNYEQFLNLNPYNVIEPENIKTMLEVP